MVCFIYTPHTNYDIRCEVSQGLNVPQNCLKVPQVCLKVPRKCLKVPPLFSGTYFTAASNISQLQALATGICSIQILILVRSTLFSST